MHVVSAILMPFKTAVINGNDAQAIFLRASMRRSIGYSRVRNQFERRKKSDHHVKGGCCFCNTLPDPDIDRKHRYAEFNDANGYGCSNYADGQLWAQQNPPVQIKYYLVGLGEVSLTFFKSLFGIGRKRIDTLRAGVLSGKPLEHNSKRGASGGHNKMSDENKECLKEIIKQQALDESHYARFDSKKSTVYVQTGITRKTIWMEFIERYDTPFYDQCKRLDFWSTYDTNKRKPTVEQYTADETDDGTIVGKALKPKVSYHACCEYINEYDIKFNINRVDICESSNHTQFKVNSQRISLKSLKHEAKAQRRRTTRSRRRGHGKVTLEIRKLQNDVVL